MPRSSDIDDHRHRSRRKRYRSSSSSSSSDSSNESRDRRRRRRRKSRDRSRDRSRRSRSRRRSSSRDRRDRRRERPRNSRSRSPEYSRRRRSRSGTAESRREPSSRRSNPRDKDSIPSSHESSREAFVIEPQSEAERSRMIDSINNAGFKQQKFVSKRDQAKAEDKPSQDAHVNAMFSATTLEEFLAGQAKKTPKLTDYKDQPELLLHENLYEDYEKRMEKWRKKLHSERRKYLNAQPT